MLRRLFEIVKRIGIAILVLGSPTAHCDINVGLQGGFGAAYILNQLTPTAAYLSQQLNQTVNAIAFPSDTEHIQALRNGSIQLSYGGPAFFTCQQITNNLVPLLSTVQYARGNPVTQQAAAIYVRNDSEIHAIADLKGKLISTGQVSQLTGFQAQLNLLQHSGISLLTETAGVFSTFSQTDAIQDVYDGRTDAAFAASALIDAIPVNVSSQLRILNSTVYPGNPYPASAPLLPLGLLAASPSVNFTTKTQIIRALTSLTPDSQATTLGGYYGWTAPDDYIPILGLLVDTGLYSSILKSCIPLTDIFSTLSCPVGFHVINGINLSNSCDWRNITCPTNHTCLCNPCQRDTQKKRIGGLSAGAFGGILGACIVLLLACGGISFKRHRSSVNVIPFDNLGVDPNLVLGKARQGLVLGGQYADTAIAVKRAYPRRKFGHGIFDDQTLQTVPPKRRRSSQDSMVDVISKCDRGICKILSTALGVTTEHKRNLLSVEKCVRLDHKNLVRILGVSSGPERDEILVVMQRTNGGTLFELLRNPSLEMTVGFALALARDVARGLEYLHNQKPPVVGRNLRTHHLLLVDDCRCLIGTSFNTTLEQGRSIIWRAPELLNGDLPTPASDVYAFAMLTYEILHRRDPFDDEDPVAVAKAIIDVDAGESKRPVITCEVPEDVTGALQACWQADPADRPAISQVAVILEQYANTSMFQSLLLEQQQANRLLRQILPEHAVQALQRGRRPSSRSFDMATVYFSDIKGYTLMSSTQQANDVMYMLNDLYTRFDNLCKSFNLMKVETIGDAYMLVGGVRESDEDHAVRVAKFALEAVKEAAKVPKPGTTGEYLSIRSGFHSGPVTSGVVGTDVPRYCLFGDTVNIANRMESTGEANRIQLSYQSVKEIKCHDPELAKRIVRRPGDVEVKSKAPMQTFWLYTDEEMERRSNRSPRSAIALEIM